MAILIIYLVVLVGIGLVDFVRAKSFDNFTVAGRTQNTASVTFSMLATIIGGSATIGLIERAYNIGFPAFWWLAVGSAGLLLQAIVLSKRVREMGLYTLPDVVELTMGKTAQVIASIIIIVSWVGILAAQFAASAKILSVYLPNLPLNVIVAMCAAAVILYTAMGGQFSVLKTDFVQFIFIAASVVVALVCLLADPAGGTAPVRIELFNEKFKTFQWIHLLVIVGGSYFIGPDMFSRLFTAKDAKTARRSSFLAAGILLAMSAFVALIGVVSKDLIPAAETNGIIPAITLRLPKFAGILFSFGLLSAILSSADTLLVTLAAIAERNVFRRSNVTAMRIMIVVFGLAGMAIAFWQKNIIGLLLSAYSIYVPGIVPPLFAGIMFHNKRRGNKPLLVAAIVAGGAAGLLSTLLKMDWLALAGFGASSVLTFFAFFNSKIEK